MRPVIMKKTPTQKPLRLDREVVRSLDQHQLAKIVGGQRSGGSGPSTAPNPSGG
jgi:hypothetical protein